MMTLEKHDKLSSICENALLVQLKVSRWTASKHDRTISIEVANSHQSDVSMGRFNKKLVAKGTILDKLNQNGRLAAKEFHRLTSPWLDDGCRMASAEAYETLFSTLTKIQEEDRRLLRELRECWPAIVEEARVALNGLFNSDDYPDVSKIGDKFSIGVNCFPLPATNHPLLKRLGQADAVNAALEERVNNSTKEAFIRIQEVVKHLKDRLEMFVVTTDGVANSFKESAVNNIKELIEVLPVLNIAGDPNLTRITEELKNELTQYTARSLKNDERSRETCIKKAESILEQVSNFI